MTRTSVTTLANVPAALRRVSIVTVQRRVTPVSKPPLCHSKSPPLPTLAEAQSPSVPMRKPRRSDVEMKTGPTDPPVLVIVKTWRTTSPA